MLFMSIDCLIGRLWQTDWVKSIIMHINVQVGRYESLTHPNVIIGRDKKKESLKNFSCSLFKAICKKKNWNWIRWKVFYLKKKRFRSVRKPSYASNVSCIWWLSSLNLSTFFSDEFDFIRSMPLLRNIRCFVLFYFSDFFDFFFLLNLLWTSVYFTYIVIIQGNNYCYYTRQLTGNLFFFCCCCFALRRLFFALWRRCNISICVSLWALCSEHIQIVWFKIQHTHTYKMVSIKMRCN